MKSPLSPSDVEVLIWCHCRPQKHERFNAPAIQESFAMFIRCGMIKENPEEKDVFRTTKKGDAMIDTLCSTPEPILVWVDVNGKVLMSGEEL